MDRYDPTRDVTPAFVDQVSDWIASTGEVLVVLRYLRAGGAKDFALCRTPSQFRATVEAVPIGTDIEVFRTPKLPVRGIVDEQLTATILAAIPDGREYLVLTTRTRPGSPLAAAWDYDDRHDELAAWLAEHAGEEIAAGPCPDFMTADNGDLTSASKGGIDGPR